MGDGEWEGEGEGEDLAVSENVFLWCPSNCKNSGANNLVLV